MAGESTAEGIHEDQIEPLLGFEIELPERLRCCLELDSRALDIPARLDTLASFLRGWDRD